MNKDTKKAPSLGKEYGALKNSFPVNNTIVCQGTTVDADYLMKRASKLTDINDQLRVILELLSLQACSKDDAMAIYFTKSTVPKIADALQGLVESFQEVADNICPD